MKLARLGRPASMVALTAFASLACTSKDNAPGLSKADDDRVFAHVPVPAAEGPKLAVLHGRLQVMDKPRGAVIGELAPGSVVARSPEAYSKSDCEGGWFAVRPRGFVCVVPGAVALDAGLAKLAPPPPDLTHSLPYRYGRAKAENTMVYTRVPSSDEQASLETDLSKHLARGEDKEPLGAAANDVPLDARFVPTGPPVLLPGGDGIKDNKRSGATFFVFANESAPPLVDPSGDVKGGALRKGSGVAIAGSFAIDGAAAPRRFGILTDGRLVPTDRIKPALGSVWHGIDLDKVGLPVAFVHKLGVHTFTLEHGKALKHDDEVERRMAVPLTGKFRTVDGIRFEETRDGTWMRSQDLVVIVKRSKLPDFATGTQKWIDVSVANQTLTAYEGKKAIYATLISTGRDLMKEPATSAATPRGSFRVRKKSVSQPLDPREVQNQFDVIDAPWSLEFEEGAAMYGSYWSDLAGEALTFHGVALEPIDAHRIWAWADPQLPDGWSAVADDTGEPTTMINIRP